MYQLGRDAQFLQVGALGVDVGRNLGKRSTIDETIIVATHIIRAELKSFYRRRRETHPTENLTRVKGLSKKRVGDNTAQTLRTKGAETYGFCIYLMERLSQDLPSSGENGRKYLRAGNALIRMVQIWRESGANLSQQAFQESWTCWNIFLTFTKDMDDMFIPKRHLLAHLLNRNPFLGNPKGYANWLDESLNRDLKYALRLVSQANFESFILLRFREFLRRGEPPHS